LGKAKTDEKEMNKPKKCDKRVGRAFMD